MASIIEKHEPTCTSGGKHDYRHANSEQNEWQIVIRKQCRICKCIKVITGPRTYNTNRLMGKRGRRVYYRKSNYKI